MILSFATILIVFGATALMRAGDSFLAYVADELNVDLEYKNHSDFASCFIRRFVVLTEPVVTLKDADLKIKCEKALIVPSFSKLITKKTIILTCTFQNAAFLSLEEKIGESDDLAAFMQGGASALMEKLLNINFDTMKMELYLREGRVDFPQFNAMSKEGAISVSGYATEDGDFDIKGKISFPPAMVKMFPPELVEMLTEDDKGWFVYSMHVEASQKNAFLKFDSDRLKIDFKQVTVE